ncbi:MAG: helix-turn-helix domain-containing protein [Panacagrimonas sp.]
MTTVYQTASLQRGQRFRYWSALMCRTFAPAHGSLGDNGDFDARITVSELGLTTVCSVSAPQQFWERTRQHVRRAPRDEFLFTQLVSGHGVLRQDGKELILRPGTMSFYDVNRPYTYEVGGEVLFVKLPRQRLMDRMSEAPLGCATAVGAEGSLAAWASGLVRRAATLDAPDSARTAELIGDSVLSAVAAVLSQQEPDREAPPQTADTPSELSRACAYIRSRLGDAQLSLASIAHAQQLSERSLYRLFADLGTTPMRWVLQQRLALSRHALEQDCSARVTDVAFAHGFNDLSHFSRVFKKTYAVTPQQVTAASRRGPRACDH